MTIDLFDVTTGIDCSVGEKPRNATIAETLAYMWFIAQRHGLPKLPGGLVNAGYYNGSPNIIGATFGEADSCGVYETGSYSVRMPGTDRAYVAASRRVVMETLGDDGEVIGSSVIGLCDKRKLRLDAKAVRAVTGPIVKARKPYTRRQKPVSALEAVEAPVIISPVADVTRQPKHVIRFLLGDDAKMANTSVEFVPGRFMFRNQLTQAGTEFRNFIFVPTRAEHQLRVLPSVMLEKPFRADDDVRQHPVNQSGVAVVTGRDNPDAAPFVGDLQFQSAQRDDMIPNDGDCAAVSTDASIGHIRTPVIATGDVKIYTIGHSRAPCGQGAGSSGPSKNAHLSPVLPPVTDTRNPSDAIMAALDALTTRVDALGARIDAPRTIIVAAANDAAPPAPKRTDAQRRAILRAWAMRREMRERADLDRRALMVANDANAFLREQLLAAEAKRDQLAADFETAMDMATAAEASALAATIALPRALARADRLARVAVDQRQRLSLATDQVRRAVADASIARAGERKAIKRLDTIRTVIAPIPMPIARLRGRPSTHALENAA